MIPLFFLVGCATNNGFHHAVFSQSVNVERDLKFSYVSAAEMPVQSNLHCYGQIDSATVSDLKYGVAYHDLNRDGVDELIIRYPVFASAGPYYSLYKRSGKGYKELLWYQSVDTSFKHSGGEFCSIHSSIKSGDRRRHIVYGYDGEGYTEK